MFEVSVEARFTATHQLRMPDGQLEPPHEHVWVVRATYAGAELDADGLLVDFGAVRARLAEALSPLDRQNLNGVAVLAGQPPSAEVVARHIARHLPASLGERARLHRVEVEEEPGCRARYESPAR